MAKIVQKFLIVVLLLLVTTPKGWGQPIYVFREADGTIHFTNKTPPQGVVAKVFTAKNVGFSVIRVLGFRSAKLFLDRYHKVISEASKLHEVDPALVKAVIHAESAFNPGAVSSKGAMGLMQLMPATARRLGVKRPFTVEENISGGVKYLAWLLKRFGGNLTHAIAAYNAGEGAVDKYNGVPPFSETQNYVRKVLNLRDRYNEKSRG